MVIVSIYLSSLLVLSTIFRGFVRSVKIGTIFLQGCVILSIHCVLDIIRVGTVRVVSAAMVCLPVQDCVKRPNRFLLIVPRAILLEIVFNACLDTFLAIRAAVNLLLFFVRVSWLLVVGVWLVFLVIGCCKTVLV